MTWEREGGPVVEDGEKMSGLRLMLVDAAFTISVVVVVVVRVDGFRVDDDNVCVETDSETESFDC